MTEIYEHNVGDHEDPVPGPTWIVGFLGAVLLVVIMLGVTALYYRAQGEQTNEVVVNRDPMELANLTSAQRARLADGAHWERNTTMEEVKEGGKTYRVYTTTKSLVIPIEQAMQAVVQEAVAGKGVGIGAREAVGNPERVEVKPSAAAAGSGG